MENVDEELVDFQFKVTIQEEVHTFSFLAIGEEGARYLEQVKMNYRSAAESLGGAIDLKVIRDGEEVQVMRMETAENAPVEAQVIVYMKLATDIAKIAGIELNLDETTKLYAGKMETLSYSKKPLSYDCITPIGGGVSECHLRGDAGGTYVDIEVQGILCDATTPCHPGF